MSQVLGAVTIKCDADFLEPTFQKMKSGNSLKAYFIS